MFTQMVVEAFSKPYLTMTPIDGLIVFAVIGGILLVLRLAYGFWEGWFGK